MAKQLMIYDNIQPLSSEAHRNWSVAIEGYQFASGLISAPLVSSEIVPASQEFPIVFSDVGDNFIPLVMMGLRENENLLIDAEGRMATQYIPGFIRRYPFIVATGNDENIVGIDVDSTTVIKDGSKGQKLFTEDGQQSPYLSEVMEFVKDYQYRADVVSVFCGHLKRLELLEPMTANINIGGDTGTSINLRGFHVVSKEKLKALGDEAILDLFKRDGLELIYAHLNSLSNINALIKKVTEKIRS